MNYAYKNIRLLELANVFSGFNYNKKQFTEDDNGVLFIQGKDIAGDLLSFNNIYRLNDVHVNFRNLLLDNDILFSAKGNRNFAYLYKSAVGKAVASSTFFVIRISGNSLLPEYLTWYLNGKIAQEYFRSQSKGTFIPSINKSQLGELEIPVPPQDIQKRIIGISKLREIEKTITKKIESKKDFLIETILHNIINNTNDRN